MDAARFDRLTRHLGRRTTRRTAVGAALGTALAGPGFSALSHVTGASQATPEPGPSGTPETEEEPVFMFVQTFASGRGEVNPGAGTPTRDGTAVPGAGASFLLKLEGHTGLTVYFSDRPDRVVGATPTQRFLDGLGFGRENPPNAALVAEFEAEQGVVVLELVEPIYDAETGTLTYGAEWLKGYKGGNLDPVLADQVAARLPAQFGPAALFIDDCPDINACLRGSTYIARIPGGPYGQCWQGAFQGGCEPCWQWETWDYLAGLCNDAFPDRCEGSCHADVYNDGRPLF